MRQFLEKFFCVHACIFFEQYGKKIARVQRLDKRFDLFFKF